VGYIDEYTMGIGVPIVRNDLKNIIDNIQTSINEYEIRLGIKQLTEQFALLESNIHDPDIWQNPEKAQKIMQEHGKVKRSLSMHADIIHDLNNIVELIELAEDCNDPELILESEKELYALAEHARKMSIEALLSGELDVADTFLEIHAGAGGTESCDWASMLLRMYIRWSERKGLKAEMISSTPGDEAGIKSCLLQISGTNAHGWLKAESGIHRLVRISPFDSQSRRHTSFASVWVYPAIDDDINIDIQDKDIRIDTFRSSGAGGQHVNTTDSAVRITHIPTGIVVTSSEKSQHQNRFNAMKALRSRLYDLEQKKRQDKIQQKYEDKTDIGWGHQIRSYVLQPYQMIKDLRSGEQSGDTQRVLDGDIDRFLMSALEYTVSKKVSNKTNDDWNKQE